MKFFGFYKILERVSDVAYRLELPVGANVPVLSWGLLATPATLDIRGRGLEGAGSQGGGTHIRFQGQPLEAGEETRFSMSSTAGAGQEEDLFTQQAETGAETAPPAAQAEEEDKGFPFVVLTPILVVILAFVARKRRR